MSKFDQDRVSKGSFMFNFNKEPDTWMTKIKNGLKPFGLKPFEVANVLFVAGIVTGFFLYDLLPLTQIFSIIKTCLEYGLGIASFIMLFHSSLQLREFPENPKSHSDSMKKFYKKAAIGISMASVAALLSVI